MIRGHVPGFLTGTDTKIVLAFPTVPDRCTHRRFMMPVEWLRLQALHRAALGSLHAPGTCPGCGWELRCLLGIVQHTPYTAL